MLKIIVVLATTFVFAGLLIAHPYTSPSVELASDAIKVKAPVQAQVAAPVRVVAKTEEVSQPTRPAAQQDALVAQPAPAVIRPAAPVASRPAPAKPAAQPESQAVDIVSVANEALAALTFRPTTPAAVPAARQPAYATATPARRTDGRHWSPADTHRMKADAVRAQSESMPSRTEVARPQADAIAGQAPSYYRPRHVEYDRRRY
jgi:hypothetical protein